MATALDQLVEGTAKAEAINAARVLKGERIESFWKVAIDGLSPEYWFPKGTSARPAEVDRQLDKARAAFAAGNLSALQRLSGRTDLTTAHQWKDWLAADERPSPTDVEILRAVIEDHDLIDSTVIVRRIMPGVQCEVTAECMPLYKEMLHSSDPRLQYWAAFVLLHFSEDLEAMPILINWLESDQPCETESQKLGISSLLRERFGENFFLDAPAWKKWWESYDQELDRRELRK